jgi:hypothetical protein
MEKIRVIVASTNSGERESVYFTRDFASPAEDFFPKWLKVDSDSRIDDNLPGGFPRDYELVRN